MFYAGSNSWNVSINGNPVGTATGNPPYSKSMEGGSEITNTSVRVAASFSSLAWYDTSGNVHNDWSGGAYTVGPGTVTVPAAPQSSFSNNYAGTGSCTANQSAEAPNMSSSVPAARIPGAVQEQLLTLADNIAAQNGDSSPTSIVAVPTTRFAANATAFGASVSGNTGVYLVQLVGNFVGHDAHLPSGAAPPRGTTLTLVVDAADMSILDWGIEPTGLGTTEFSSLGAVTTLSGSPG